MKRLSLTDIVEESKNNDDSSETDETVSDKTDDAMSEETNDTVSNEQTAGEEITSVEELVGEPIESDDSNSDPSEQTLEDVEHTVLTPSAIISPDNDYECHENVAVDLVNYVRSNTIRNEEQFLLLTLGFCSGLSDDPGEYISTVTIGTSSSGKSHLKDTVEALFKHCDVMNASTGSDKSLFYSDEWDEADIISMGELQQPSEEMLEFMKRAHGGDGEVVIRSTRGNPSTGFHEKVIRKDAKAYHFTFAQFDADFEFWNRLLKIPAHESESKNRAVGRLAAGHTGIDLGDGIEYGYLFEDGTERLQAHMLDVKRNAPGRVVLPTDGDMSDFDTWDVIKPIFRHSRSESNRVYEMVINLIKASARCNFHNRETIRTHGTDTLVAEAQDVANVMQCLDQLRATTNEISSRKRAVVEAIKEVSNEDGIVSSLEPIIAFLEASDASHVRKSELEAILDELEEEYLIVQDGDKIRARNWDALGMPAIDEYEQVFADCVDPLSGEPFLDAWEDYTQSVLATGDDIFDTGDDDIESSGGAVVGTDVSDVSVDTDAIADAFEFESWEAEIVGVINNVLHDTRVSNLATLPVEGYIGCIDPNDPDGSNVTTEGSLLDPTHDVWDHTDKPNDWVSTETEARVRIQDVITKLAQSGQLGVVDIHERDDDGTPTAVTVVVDLEASDEN